MTPPTAALSVTPAGGRHATAPNPRIALALILALLAALAAVPGIALVPGTPFSATTAAAATGLTMTADARYVVDPAKKAVHVSVGLTATNHRTDTKTRRYFYDQAFLAVQPGTTNFRITSPGASPAVRVQRRTATYTLLRLDFGKQLGSGASRKLNLSFDIIDKGGAPARTTRIGTSLVSFGAWGFGSDGVRGGTVTVVFPAGFSVDVEAAGLGAPTTDAAGTITYRTGQLANPLSFFAYFVAGRPGAFTESILQVPIGGGVVPVTLRAWPDDPAWATRVSGLLYDGLPILAEEIGLPWGIDQPLVVEEALSRSASGFAGRYNPPEGRIEIAYYADSFVILHEAAHAWFDGSLVADRWASEGFASWYALRAAQAIGAKDARGDALTEELEAVRIPLNAWGPPGSQERAVEDAEYAAALRLAALVAERAGAENLAAVWQAVRAGRAPYQPAGAGAALETATAPPDWRGLLDLLEERTGKSFDDLWTAWVVRPEEAPLLAERRAARAAYADLTARAADWRLPRVIRDALRSWQYDQVLELAASANRALDARDSVESAATEAGLTPPATMRTAFEASAGFTAAVAEAQAELAAIATYRDAAAARLVGVGPIEGLGLWNSDPEHALATAAEAFAAGDLEASVESAGYARGTWESAFTVGRNRVIAIVGTLGALLLGSWLAFRWARDRSLRRRSIVTGA
ncbi:MAG TPA: hypothetical protein VFK35_09855 [Candidatus Limnocylindrales bacterium]|nr:hypothetical protein [Candidatus Limnocylindrales bacterium]